MAEHILMTALSPTMEEGTIVSWLIAENSPVKIGDILCEVETDKATMDYEADQQGILLKILKESGSKTSVGQPIAIIGNAGDNIDDLLYTDAPTPESQKTDPIAPNAPVDTQSPARAIPENSLAPEALSTMRIKASPLARNIAKMRNIDLRSVVGSGPGGRIVKRDVEAAISNQGTAMQTPIQRSLEDKKIPVSGAKSIVASRLSESKFSAPHFYLKLSVDASAIIASREALNATQKEKVSFNAFLIKFVAEALRRNPEINASWQSDSIIQFGAIDIGLAVDQGNGLLTPIVRDCANKGIIDIDQELRVLIEKASAGRLKPEEYTGATFTISSLGAFGIEEFTAIINPPGSAILAVGKIINTPVVDKEGAIVISPIMKLTLSCDHRVIDGLTGACFLNDLKQMLESPIHALY